MNDYLYYHNANAGGAFITSKENDRLFRWGQSETITDVKPLIKLAQAHGTVSIVDAIHHALYKYIYIQDIDKH